jgi:hypothetical protein
MNTQDYSKLIDFRSAMISALPLDPANSELEFEDMLTMIEVILKSNEAIDRLSQPITAKTQMNAVMYDPDEVAFRSEPVTQTFSKEDLLRGYDHTGGMDIEKQTTQVTQQPEQPINRDSYIQPFPPTPQNSSYGNDLRNMNQQPQYPVQQPQYNQPNVEVLPTPWDGGADYGNAQIHQSLSMMPPEFQGLLANAARYGNLQLVLAEMGGQYYPQQ